MVELCTQNKQCREKQKGYKLNYIKEMLYSNINASFNRRQLKKLICKRNGIITRSQVTKSCVLNILHQLKYVNEFNYTGLVIGTIWFYSLAYHFLV